MQIINSADFNADLLCMPVKSINKNNSFLVIQDLIISYNFNLSTSIYKFIMSLNCPLSGLTVHYLFQKNDFSLVTLDSSCVDNKF